MHMPLDYELPLSLLKKELSTLDCVHAGYDSGGLEPIDVQNFSRPREKSACKVPAL